VCFEFGDHLIGLFLTHRVISIFDLKITMLWEGNERLTFLFLFRCSNMYGLYKDTSGEKTVSGTVTAVEVSHDMDESDYRFETSLDSGSGKEAEELRAEAGKLLADRLRSKLQEFQPVRGIKASPPPHLPFFLFNSQVILILATQTLISTHGKDLLKDVNDSPASSGTTTPVRPGQGAAVAAPKAAPSAPATSAQKSGGAINTTTVNVEGQFQASADDLFDFLTNEQKIPMWTRNPAKVRRLSYSQAPRTI
jgi:activator of HSP90 ATPase